MMEKNPKTTNLNLLFMDKSSNTVNNVTHYVVHAVALASLNVPVASLKSRIECLYKDLVFALPDSLKIQQVYANYATIPAKRARACSKTSVLAVHQQHIEFLLKMNVCAWLIFLKLKLQKYAHRAILPVILAMAQVKQSVLVAILLMLIAFS